MGKKDKLKSPGCAQLLTAEQMTHQLCPPRLRASDGLGTYVPRKQMGPFSDSSVFCVGTESLMQDYWWLWVEALSDCELELDVNT